MGHNSEVIYEEKEEDLLTEDVNYVYYGCVRTVETICMYII